MPRSKASLEGIRIQELLNRYLLRGWQRRLRMIKFLLDNNGRVEWDKFRDECIKHWGKISYTIIANQLYKDGLLIPEWNEKEFWNYVKIPEELLPIIKNEMEKRRLEIEKILEGDV